MLLPPGRRRRRRWPPVLAASAIVLAVAALAAGGLLLAERDALPAGTTIAGVDVGGKDRDDARGALERAARLRARRPVALRSEAASFAVTGTQLGARPLADQAIDAADDVGLLDRLRARLGLGGSRDLPLRFAFDRRLVAGVTKELDQRLAVRARDAFVDVTATDVSVTPAVTGRSVDRATLSSRLRTLPPRVDVPLRVVAPAVSTASAERARTTIEQLLAEPRSVGLRTTLVTLQPQLLRRMLRLDPADGEVVVSLDPELLERRLRPAFRKLERRARDATWATDGASARVVPAVEGRELDAERIGASLVENLGSRIHRARFRDVEPQLTTEAAEALRVTELVSEFTTEYPCCAPRVSNIQRAARVLDGTVLRPRERFSLNDALGKRTPEKGYVSAPQILAGRLEDAVGGGISQVATTLYNAAFFAGLRLDAHQAHQFYISRYPMGREATVSWGGPELVFTNDWPVGLLMRVSAGDTSITFRFYSSLLARRVETTTEAPYAYRQPTTRVTKNRSLPAGERLVLQKAGGPGFTVAYTRTVYRGTKRLKDERFVVRYDPQNGYVEVGPPKKPKKKPPGKPPRPGVGPPPAVEPPAVEPPATEPVAG